MNTHYDKLAVQPIEIMKANWTEQEYRAFLKGNILKYTLRRKNGESLSDAHKIKHYAEMLIESYKRERENAERPRKD